MPSSAGRSASRSRSRSTAAPGRSSPTLPVTPTCSSSPQLEEAFGADGAIVLATTPHDWHETADRYGDEPVRFPLFTEVAEQRRITIIVDPGGVVRHVGLRRSARETLAALEGLLVGPQLRVAA